MRNFSNMLLKGAVIAASFVALASCGSKAVVEGVIEGAADSQIVVNLLDVNKLTPIDTLYTDASGAFKISVPVEKGRPEFIYIYRDGARVAPVLLSAGDRISVKADTLGGFEVSGTPDAELYAGAEKDYAAFAAKMATLAEAGDAKALSAEYIAYYRGRVQFVMANSSSLAVVPVFYQSAGTLSVFGQETDAIIINNVCTSLEAAYPESRYVKALRKNADERMSYLQFSSRLEGAEEVSYVDIELPDMSGEKVKLSSVDAKVVMVLFWAAADPAQKMFNIDALLPIYEKYHSRGFEIYQVGLDIDKTDWASTMKNQNLPWINVCDVAGGDSRYVTLYNVTSLPMAYFIADGELVLNENVKDEAGIRALLDKLLK